MTCIKHSFECQCSLTSKSLIEEELDSACTSAFTNAQLPEQKNRKGYINLAGLLFLGGRTTGYLTLLKNWREFLYIHTYILHTYTVAYIYIYICIIYIYIHTHNDLLNAFISQIPFVVQ